MSIKNALRAALVGKLLKELVAEADAASRGEALRQLLLARDSLGLKSVDVSLADGTVVGSATLTAPSGGISINETGLLEWAQREHPDEVVPTVRDSFRKVARARLKVVDGKVIDKTTGEAVPWASVRLAAPQPTSFSVRYAEDGRDALVEAIKAGELTDMMPGLLAVEGGETDA